MSNVRPRVVTANVLCAILLGTACSFWVIYFTDWFPVVGGLLALSGGFTWLAFVLGILKNERKEAAQDWFDRKVLQNRGLLLVLLLLGLAFGLGVGTRYGTVIIDTLGDDTTRDGRVSKKENLRIAVKGRSETRLVLGVGTYELMLSGLPTLTVDISPWQRTRVVVPEDFLLVPIVLLKPGAILSGEAMSQGNFSLQISVNGKACGRLDTYLGETVWIGSARDVVVPSRRIDSWRQQLIDAGFPASPLNRWRYPRLVEGNCLIADKDTVSAVVSRGTGPNTLRLGQASVIVQVAANAASFPQELGVYKDN